MEYISTKEASAKWGISTIRITVLANEGRIPGAQRLGRSWLIPATATKPQELKPNHTSSGKKKKSDDFLFPIYHFRPDWSYISENKLTQQQQRLLSAENAVFECRFGEAYQVLEDILQNPEDIITEIGCLWNAGICSIALNKPDDFSKIFIRIQMILSEEIPHHDDLIIILDSLKTYTQNLSTIADEYTYNTDIHDQCLPMACLLAGYSQLGKEAMKPRSTDINQLELNLRLIKNTGAIYIEEFLHLYIFGIYSMRNEVQKAEKHARAMYQIAYENKFYFPIVTYHRYFGELLTPIFMKYPEDFQNHINKLISDYNDNYVAFFSIMEEYNAVLRLKDTDFPYIYAVMTNSSNDEIAERMNVSPRTVKRKLETIFKMLNVNNKKELRDYLKTNI